MGAEIPRARQIQIAWNIIQPSEDEEILPLAQTQMDLKDIMLG